MRSQLGRSLLLFLAGAALLAWLADLAGIDWHQDPDAALAVLIAIAAPALILPPLLTALAGRPQRLVPMPASPGHPLEPRPPAAQRQRQMRTRPRRRRRRPRIVMPAPCIHCGRPPKHPRRPPRILPAPPPRPSLAALIAAATPAPLWPAPRRAPRIVRRH